VNQHVDPSRFAPPSPAVAASVSEPLTIWKADLHDLNEAMGGVAKSIKYDHRDFIDRTMMNHLGNSAFKLIVAITTRTFQFEKVAETIAQDQYTDGLRKYDADKKLAVDKYGQSIFEGTGMTRNPVKAALKELTDKGVISSFTVMVPKTGPVTAYMPISWRNLYIAGAKYNAVLPRLFRIAEAHPMIYDLITRPPVHELEARYGAQFYEGMNVVRMIEKMYRNDFSRYSEKAVCEAIYVARKKLEHEGQQLTVTGVNL
jgi:DNA-binding Lrp family transcriptional regulator